MKALFVDTSAWYAHMQRDDPDHAPVRRRLEPFRGELVTSDFVFDELVTLVQARLGHAAAVRAGELLLDPREVRLESVLPDDQKAAWRLFLDCPDKNYSFTDCTSFVLMRRLGLRSAAALDENFEQEGFSTVP